MSLLASEPSASRGPSLFVSLQARTFKFSSIGGFDDRVLHFLDRAGAWAFPETIQGWCVPGAKAMSTQIKSDVLRTQ